MNREVSATMDDVTSLEIIEPIAEPPVVNGLQAVSIAKSYDKRVVLTDVSVSVGRGEVIGLLGPNGAGKTTCFYSVMGLVKPDAGRIMLDGQDITGLPMYRRAILGLGYLPQETSIFRGLTIEKNILAVLELNISDPVKRQERLDRLLDEFGLTRLRAAPAMALSGGERRRAEIARALAADPTIMLLDEPRSGEGPEAPRHRRADHRPQRPRDARYRRPRLYHLRRPRIVHRLARGAGRGRQRAAAVSRRGILALMLWPGFASRAAPARSPTWPPRSGPVPHLE